MKKFIIVMSILVIGSIVMALVDNALGVDLSSLPITIRIVHIFGYMFLGATITTGMRRTN